MATLAAAGGCGRQPAARAHLSARRSSPEGAAPRKTASPPVVQQLPLGAPREIRSALAEPKVFGVSLSQGQLLRVTLEQRGADAAIDLHDPTGRKVLAVDSPNGTHGQEPLIFVAPSTGLYRLETRCTSECEGSYSLAAHVELRPTSAGREAARACLRVSDADALYRQPDLTLKRASLPLYEEALAAWRRAGLREGEILAELRLGRALARFGDAHAGVAHLERARALRRTSGLEAGTPEICNELGAAYRHLDDPVRSRAAFEAARAAARHLSERREEAAALNGLALLAQQAGELWEALVLYEQALADFREVGDHGAEATSLHNQGTLLIQLGELPQAHQAFEQALAVYQDLHQPGNAAASAMELGWVRSQEGDAVGAERTLLRALALRRQARDRRGEGATLDRLGSLARDSGKPQEAIRLYRQALTLLRETGERRTEATTHSNLGGALVLAGNGEAALGEEDEALLFLAGGGQPSEEAFARWRRAQALRLLGRLEEARREAGRVLDLLERIRTGATSAGLRRDYLDWTHEPFEFEIDLLMEMHERWPGRGFDAAALAEAERSRARGLLDLIQGERQRGPGAGSTVDRLREVERQVRDVEAQVQHPLPAAAAALPTIGDSAPLRDLLAQREQLRIELRRAQGAAEKPPHLVSVSEIQHRLLDPQTTLLVYSLGDRRSFVWAVTPKGLASAVLPARRDLEDAARRLHDLAAQGTAIEAQLLEQRLTARSLSDLLLKPVASRLPGVRLAVVADGALAYLPFQLLPEPGGAGALLLDRHEVVMLPSASVLAALRHRAEMRRPAPHQIAVLADPLFQPPGAHPGAPPAPIDPALAATLRDVRGSSRNLGLSGLADLPYSRREAAAIVALARTGQSFSALGAAATRELATGGRLSPYRIVHFATHALAHSTTPELSGIVLSLFDAAGHPRPGFLRSYEILDLDLPADLVVLSACQTGLGRELKGEGLVGLTQSFFHAGATRVVVSLWNVDDQATATLMTRFYEGLLRRHLPPAAALREAQLAVRADRRWSAPFYWAGFQLQGDWRPID